MQKISIKARLQRGLAAESGKSRALRGSALVACVPCPVGFE